MILLLWVGIGVVLIVTLVDNILRYRHQEKHEAHPLSGSDRVLCARIVDAGLGIPWICSRSLESGMCPSMPCPLLKKARQGTLAAIHRFESPR